MVLISGSNFFMGSDDEDANPDEFPIHEVKVNSFWMDVTEVTNAQFQKFVDEFLGLAVILLLSLKQ